MNLWYQASKFVMFTNTTNANCSVSLFLNRENISNIK